MPKESKQKRKICKHCSKEFEYCIKVDGKWCVTNRRYCYDCKPFRSSNSKPLDFDDNPNRICKVCSKKYIYDGKYNKPGHRKNKCNSCKTLAFHKSKKLKSVNFLGGKCKHCGYNKHIEALCFHHTSDNKEYTISRMYNLSWEKIKKELEKCILLCLNCHAEEHVRLDENKCKGKAVNIKQE